MAKGKGIGGPPSSSSSPPPIIPRAIASMRKSLKSTGRPSMSSSSLTSSSSLVQRLCLRRRPVPLLPPPPEPAPPRLLLDLSADPRAECEPRPSPVLVRVVGPDGDDVDDALLVPASLRGLPLIPLLLVDLPDLDPTRPAPADGEPDSPTGSGGGRRQHAIARIGLIGEAPAHAEVIVPADAVAAGQCHHGRTGLFEADGTLGLDVDLESAVILAAAVAAAAVATASAPVLVLSAFAFWLPPFAPAPDDGVGPGAAAAAAAASVAPSAPPLVPVPVPASAPSYDPEIPTAVATPVVDGKPS
eukprot:CAMPEP_0178680110 /NCGR_PEP_ID=MMETSP0699-20121125/537_2 /TAXON_ID=265572 /ORGANISM="Extubocellulus spinifer, Strain CCMP396" /LENGTH=300 /DNA_ID=CAMNT_0020324499 /DNA_START=85 /DNA_END=989 /DNA_ORIENTATION=-